jgi:hypothetical protein
MTINHDAYHKKPTKNIRQALEHIKARLVNLREGAVTDDEFMAMIRDEMVDLTYETLSDMAMGWAQGDDGAKTLRHEAIKDDLWEYTNKVYNVFEFEFYGGKAGVAR